MSGPRVGQILTEQEQHFIRATGPPAALGQEGAVRILLAERASSPPVHQTLGPWPEQACPEPDYLLAEQPETKKDIPGVFHLYIRVHKRLINVFHWCNDVPVLKIRHQLVFVRSKGGHPGPDRDLFQEININHHNYLYHHIVFVCKAPAEEDKKQFAFFNKMKRGNCHSIASL